MSRKFAVLAAFCCLAWLQPAFAVALGEIEVDSALNQRFSAVIPLSSLGADEAESLQVRMASTEEFARAGIEWSAYLGTLKFELAGKGAPVIKVSSAQIAREPFLSFLVEVRSRGSRVLREYTVLLDPPPLAAAAPKAAPAAPKPIAAPAAAPSASAEFYQTAEESSRSVPPPAAPPVVSTPAEPAAPPPVSEPAPAAVSAPVAANSGGSTYGPIQAGETFWSIATKLRPDPSVTMDQMLLAIYQGNPAAFDGGLNGLLKGSTLSVPGLDTILATDAVTAKARINALRGIKSAPAARPAAPKPKPAKPVAAVKPAEPVVTAVEPAPQPKPEPAPVAAEPEPAAAVTAAPVVEPSAVEAPPQVAVTTPDSGVPAEDRMVDPPAAEKPKPKVVVYTPPERDGLLGSYLIPAIAGLIVLVLGFVGWRFLKQRQERQQEEFSPPVRVVPTGAVAAAAVKPAPPARSEREKLQDTQVEAAPVKPAEATQQLNTQQLKTQQLGATPVAAAAAATTAVLPDFDSTQIFDAPKPASAIATDQVDFDVTAQFAADTLQINLDSNDPLSEADFHLAYGLYDEAALLLKQAAEKNPGRTELRVKLAETYFAAGKPVEFQETAEALKPQLSSPEWQKLAIMGRQLCPDAALFKGGDDAIADLGGIDLAFDDVADEPNEPPAAAPPMPAVAAPAAAAPAAAADSVLDFSLEELELPLPTAQPKPAEPLQHDQGAVLEFNLSDFDLGPGEVAAATDSKSAAALELDAQHFDLGSAFDEPAQPAAASAPKFDDSVLDVSEIRLDEFDLGDDGPSEGPISGDEVSTKLDLARAYVDMGDNEMARSLLGEVALQGNPAQQADAQALLARLV